MIKATPAGRGSRLLDLTTSTPIHDHCVREPENLLALHELRALVDLTTQDWDRFQRDAVRFHLRNAKAWGNASAGRDLADQVDPGFLPARKTASR
jgi:hypothetical protein